MTSSPVRLLRPTDVRELAASVGLRPTKRLGQNFVIEAGAVRRIVQATGVGPCDVVLEVGPGLGSLTLGLLEAAGRVIAVEVDPELAALLPDTARRHAAERAESLHVIAGDALLLDRLPPPPPNALVANLPYNVATPVLLHVLAGQPTVDRGLVMVQSEVADRLCAGPGSRVYGAPSVKLAWHAAARAAGNISRNVFWPVPGVDSRLVAFARRTPPATSASRAEVFEVIDAAFAQRRKTLRTALAGWAGSTRAAADALRAAGIDPAARGETLDVAAFARLAQQRPPRDTL